MTKLIIFILMTLPAVLITLNTCKIDNTSFTSMLQWQSPLYEHSSPLELTNSYFVSPEIAIVADGASQHNKILAEYLVEKILEMRFWLIENESFKEFEDQLKIGFTLLYKTMNNMKCDNLKALSHKLTKKADELKIRLDEGELQRLINNSVINDGSHLADVNLSLFYITDKKVSKDDNTEPFLVHIQHGDTVTIEFSLKDAGDFAKHKIWLPSFISSKNDPSSRETENKLLTVKLLEKYRPKIKTNLSTLYHINEFPKLFLVINKSVAEMISLPMLTIIINTIYKSHSDRTSIKMFIENLAEKYMIFAEYKEKLKEASKTQVDEISQLDELKQKMADQMKEIVKNTLVEKAGNKKKEIKYDPFSTKFELANMHNQVLLLKGNIKTKPEVMYNPSKEFIVGQPPHIGSVKPQLPMNIAESKIYSKFSSKSIIENFDNLTTTEKNIKQAHMQEKAAFTNMDDDIQTRNPLFYCKNSEHLINYSLHYESDNASNNFDDCVFKALTNLSFDERTIKNVEMKNVEQGIQQFINIVHNKRVSTMFSYNPFYSVDQNVKDYISREYIVKAVSVSKGGIKIDRSIQNTKDRIVKITNDNKNVFRSVSLNFTKNLDQMLEIAADYALDKFQKKIQRLHKFVI